MAAIASIASAVYFAEPWWLLALGAVLIPPAVAAAARRRGRHAAYLSVALQCASVALMALALARPELPVARRAQKPYLVLRDVSGSVRGQQLNLPWPKSLLREELEFASTVGPGGGMAPLPTNAAPAMRLAGARAGQIAGVVIITDGQFHDDWRAAAADLARAGKDVTIVPLDSPPPDARVARMTARRRAAGPGASAVDVEVTVASGAAQARALAVERRGTKPFPPRLLNMHAGDTATVSFTDDAPPADRAATYVASLATQDDAFPENDRLSAAVFPVRQVVAWLAPGGYRREGLESALASSGVQVRRVAPGEAPEDAAGWADYAAAVIVEPGAAGLPLLSARARAALAEYVRGGGGLLQIGTGPHKTPHDRDDPVNRVAALVANPYERKPLKVIVVLDASGSMSEPAAGGPEGTVRFDLAVQAVMALQRHLTKDDSLAVLTFSDVPQVVYDGGAEADFGRLHQALKRIRPGGRTVVLPALRQAAGVPVPPPRDGLVLLVSDLLTERFDPQRAAELFAGGRLKLAIVVASPPGGADSAQAPLRELAKTLGVRLKEAGDLAGLADVFVEFLSDARGEALRRGQFTAVAPGGAKILGVDAAGLPAVRAYYVSAPQDAAEVLLHVKDDPLLAIRQTALGRVVSLALPTWLNEPAETGGRGFDPLLVSAVRNVLRQTDVPGFTGAARREDGRVHIELAAHDPARPTGQWPADGLKLTAAVAGSQDDAWRQVELAQTAPGLYEANVPADDKPVGVVVRDASGREVWRDSLAGGYPAEFAAIGANMDNLRKLAQLTGGTIRQAADLRELTSLWDRRQFRPVRLHAIAIAVALMLLDWATTRIWRRT